MYLGNIITESDIEIENFNTISTIEDNDTKLPTLIVGWSLVKQLFPETSILHKQINENFFWTFSEKERRVDYETDIEDFKEKCFNNIGKDITYVYVDILYTSKSKIKRIIKKIKSFKNPIYYISNNKMLYIYDENMVFGVDLNITEFIGVDNSKILSKLKDLPNSTLLKNEIFNKCSSIIKKIKNNNKILPYIYRYGECD